MRYFVEYTARQGQKITSGNRTRLEGVRRIALLCISEGCSNVKIVDERGHEHEISPIAAASKACHHCGGTRPSGHYPGCPIGSADSRKERAKAERKAERAKPKGVDVRAGGPGAGWLESEHTTLAKAKAWVRALDRKFEHARFFDKKTGRELGTMRRGFASYDEPWQERWEVPR